MSASVYRSVDQLKGFSAKNCPSMPEPTGVLMCPPDHYDVLDVKNPFMAGRQGSVDRALARRQWEALKAAFQRAGKEVSLLEPAAGLEDMVFCTDHAVTGVSPKMEKICVIGQMRHASRRRETPAHERWYAAHGYRIVRLKDRTVCLEGGDAIWHPGKRLLWAAYGFRSDAESYDEVAAAFSAPVMLLKLANERYYHLDTCFCPLTSEAVLIYPSAFDGPSLELILRLFPVVLTVPETEAARLIACNAMVLDGRLGLVQKDAAAAARHIAAMGLKVEELDTSEFLKSGGGLRCLKSFLY